MSASLADRVLTMTPNEIRNGLTDVTRRAEVYMDEGFSDLALGLYTDAITYLSQMAWFGHPLEHAFTILTNADTRIPSDAAACAVACGQYEKALELLENGRCTFWAQSQYLNLDLDKIRERDPDLAQKLDTVGKQLDADPTLFAGRYDLATDYNKLILAARKYVPDFAYPPPFAETCRRLQQKTVVVLVASRYCCFALVVKTDDTEPRSQVEHIPLPFITWSRVSGMSNSLKNALSGARREVRGAEPSRELVRNRPSSVDINLAIREILATLWTAVVFPVLSHLKIQPCEQGGTPSTRLWWCATGPFSFLPIHAAGTFTEPVRCCLDYVVSSYTPKLSALPLDRPLTELPLSLATMGDVHTPGQVLLPAVEAEIQQIRSTVQTHASEFVRFYRVDLGPSALERRKSIEGILDRIRRTDIIHFASHASQNIIKPLSSAIYLPSCSLTIEQLWRFKFQRYSKPRLVVMSACQTAAGAKDLPNEAVHLAGTLVFAGVPSIVGTMWSIIDTDGPTFANSFYRHLFQQGADLNFVAEAVHTAVQKLRTEGLPFSRWVPFLHMGN